MNRHEHLEIAADWFSLAAYHARKASQTLRNSLHMHGVDYEGLNSDAQGSMVEVSKAMAIVLGNLLAAKWAAAQEE